MSFVERRRFLWLLFLIGLGLIAVVANATTFARLRLEDLAQQASAVARLRCLTTESVREQDEIWTETRFEVLETAKGFLPGLVAVRTLGGRAGHLQSHVDGAPRFRPGEEVYLFLWGTPEQPYRVLGWAQGTFRIARNPKTGIESITQDSAGMAVFDPATRSFRHGAFRNVPVPLFRARLRKAIESADSR